MMIATTALWIAIAAPPSDVCSQKATKIAVLDVVARDITKNQAELVSELLQREIRAHGCSVIARSDIEAMLGLEKLKDTLSCDSTACLAEIGGALGVDEIVNGAVGKVGDIVVFTFKRIDPAHSVVVKQAVRQVDTAEDENFLAEVPFVAADLFGWSPPAHREVSAPKKKAAPTSELTIIPKGKDDQYDVAVKTSAQLYRCSSKVTATTPCQLTLPPGDAVVMVKDKFDDPRKLAPGITRYQIGYHPRWPWVVWTVAGIVIGGGADFLAFFGPPPFGFTNDQGPTAASKVAFGVAVVVGTVSLIGGLIGTFAYGGDHSIVDEPKAEIAW